MSIGRLKKDEKLKEKSFKVNHFLLKEKNKIQKEKPLFNIKEK